MEQFNLTFPQKNIYMVDMLNSDTALNTIAGVFKIDKNNVAKCGTNPSSVAETIVISESIIVFFSF